MEENKVLLYMFTGLLESGKTSFIHNVLEDDDFTEGKKNLLLSCESGEVEYDEELLKKSNTEVIYIEEESQLTGEYFAELEKKYNPEKVFLEFNGTWSVQEFLKRPFPTSWVLVEMLGCVDATTFGVYLLNMRPMLFDQLYASDVVLVNRCSPMIKKSFLRLNIKSMNPRTQIIYESLDGGINELEDDELFEEVDGVIQLADLDYGMWYVDAFDEPSKYVDKKIKLKGSLYHGDDGGVVLGRRAMVCCADDIAFAALLCNFNGDIEFEDEDWYMLEGTLDEVFEQSIDGTMPALIVKSYEKTEAPEDEFVYFN